MLQTALHDQSFLAVRVLRTHSWFARRGDATAYLHEKLDDGEYSSDFYGWEAKRVAAQPSDKLTSIPTCARATRPQAEHAAHTATKARLTELQRQLAHTEGQAELMEQRVLVGAARVCAVQGTFCALTSLPAP